MAVGTRGVNAWSGRVDAPAGPDDPVGLCTCSLPLPRGCPLPEDARSCVGCPVAEVQDLDAHVGADAALLDRAARDLLGRAISSDWTPHSAHEYVLDLYTRTDTPGSSLPKAVLFALYKGRQFGAEPMETAWGADALSGRPVARWPDEVQAIGLPWGRMFVEYGKRYEG